MTITPQTPGVFRVQSESGHAYTVRYLGSGDGDPEFVAVWECDCPAYQYGHGKLCKHINAVIAYNYAMEGEA